MLQSVNRILGYGIEAKDGSIGTVHDLFFSDDVWNARYLVVDTGWWLPGRKVLISTVAVRKVDGAERVVSVDLLKSHVRTSPVAETDKPVSRQHEIELHHHYSWPFYWGDPEAQKPAPLGEAAEWDPHLRSAREVTRYAIEAIDGDTGHVKDLVVDDESWTIPFLAVDTRKWLPGRKVLVSPDRVQEILWDRKTVSLNMTREEIRESPSFDASRLPAGQASGTGR